MNSFSTLIYCFSFFYQIIKERELELQKEHRRQEDNDKLRREFARLANEFHQWLTDCRGEMMEASGSLEQQLDCIRRKAQDIRSQRSKLKKIEELGALLEEHLILDNRYTGEWAFFKKFP